MQVAIPGMKHVDDRQTRRIGFGIDQLQDLSQRPLGNDGILHQKVGTDLTHQSTGHLPRLPQPFAGRIVITELNTRRPGSP